jgi:CMP/dCMP kinase
MSKLTFAIAIDGPVAAGKGTIAQKLARDLKGFHLYTGAMYRCLALLCLQKGIELSDTEAVIAVLPQFSISFRNERVYLHDEDVTDRIKQKDAASGSSVVAVDPRVRKEMVLKQQEIGKAAMADGKIVVSEGRDTATKVFPDSPFKVYLTASDTVRAERRLAQYKAQGKDRTLEEIIREIHERDKRDMGRVTDPLPSNPTELGYFVLDNSKMNEEETVHALHAELRKRELIDD